VEKVFRYIYGDQGKLAKCTLKVGRVFSFWIMMVETGEVEGWNKDIEE
jgi:hypothetical protein